MRGYAGWNGWKRLTNNEDSSAGSAKGRNDCRWTGLSMRLSRKRAISLKLMRAEREILEKYRTESQHQTIAVLSALSQGVACVDEYGKIIFMNSVVEQSLGLSDSVAEGDDFHEMMHPGKLQSHECKLENCAILKMLQSGEQNTTVSESFFKGNGVILPLMMRCSSYRDAYGKNVWVVGFQVLVRRASGGSGLRLSENNNETHDLKQKNYIDEINRTFLQIKTQNNELVEMSHEIQRLNEEMQTLTTLDGMTGVPNHRTFQERLRSAWVADRRRSGVRLLSLLMLDIDFFKQYNEAFGRAAGDEALKTVANLVRGSIRNEDMLARFGGEEFVIVAWDTDTETAMGLADRLCKLIEGHLFPNGKITISVGVATHDIRQETPTSSQSWYVSPEAIIRAADDALYHAKKIGRNQACFIGDIDQEAV